KGDMSFDGSARILGTFEGKIAAKGDLHIADGATCKAIVETGRITVYGMIEGNVTARDRVELASKAKMRGDLVASRLLVADGASFIGHVTVGSEAKGGGGGGGKAPEQSRMTEPKPVPIPVKAEAVRH